jgi:hypothetical protein
VILLNAFIPGAVAFIGPGVMLCLAFRSAKFFLFSLLNLAGSTLFFVKSRASWVL